MNPLSGERAPSKRIWRVPRDRGPVEAFATLVCKALRKHGWPAAWRACPDPQLPAFIVYKVKQYGPPTDDFWSAVEIAARVTGAQNGVDVVQLQGYIELAHSYAIDERGNFRRVANHAAN